MIDEAKKVVETLRYCEESGARCGECPSGKNEQGIPNCHSQGDIADLIESLSAELEQTKQERDGLNVMLGQAQSMLETRTRERDAAIKDIPRTCGYCKYFRESTYKCTNKFPCACISGVNTRWEWRGVKEDDNG